LAKARTRGSPSGKDAVRVSKEQVTAFRLSRHHLDRRADRAKLNSVLAEMGGAQAQLLLAGQMSAWARVRDVELADLQSDLWKDRTLVKAWCMRRTMFLLPSEELSVFVRGSALRAEREIRWALSKGVPSPKLEELVASVLEALEEPITQGELARAVSRATGNKLTHRKGGGWGSRRKVPCVKVNGIDFPASYLLHLAGARGVYCSGESRGSESTFVRADRWVPRWKDIPREEAEVLLLRRYLGAFGPSTPSDFAFWTGMFATDAKGIWSRGEPDMVEVDVEGEKAYALRSDLPGLLNAHLDVSSVRLLPFFDSYLLGHRSHQNVVGPEEHGRVYRPQGWVSPVLLVDGRARGTWSHMTKKNRLEVVVKPFSRLETRLLAPLRDEAEDLGRFLGCGEASLRLF
jgi:hypothetical protein